MFVGYQRAATGARLVGLQGSQEQEGGPGELASIGLLPTNRIELVMNEYFSIPETLWNIT